MISGEAPDFELTAIDGALTSLRELLKSGPVLLAFFKTGCPTCKLTFPFLQRLHERGARGALQIVAVSQDDAALTRAFNAQFGITFRTLLDPAGQSYPASNAYRISDVPSLFLVKPDSRISLSTAGFDKASLEFLGDTCSAKVFDVSDRVPVFRPG